MSYRSRLYNHRNAQSPEVNDKPFFSKQYAGNDVQKKGSFFQAKLSVNNPGDAYEEEADAMADKVIQRLSNTSFSNSENNQTPFFTKSVKPLQRKCAGCQKEDNNKLQKKGEEK